MDENDEIGNRRVWLDEAFADVEAFRRGWGLAYIPRRSIDELASSLPPSKIYEDDGRPYTLERDVVDWLEEDDPARPEFMPGFAFDDEELAQACGGWRIAEQVLMNGPAGRPEAEAAKLSVEQTARARAAAEIDGLSSRDPHEDVPAVFFAEAPRQDRLAWVPARVRPGGAWEKKTVCVVDAPEGTSPDAAAAHARAALREAFPALPSSALDAGAAPLLATGSVRFGSVDEAAQALAGLYDDISAPELAAAVRLAALDAPRRPELSDGEQRVVDAQDADELREAFLALGEGRQDHEEARRILDDLMSGQCYYNPKLEVYIDSWANVGLADGPEVYIDELAADAAALAARDASEAWPDQLQDQIRSWAPIRFDEERGEAAFRADVARIAASIAAGGDDWVEVGDLSAQGMLESRRKLAEACLPWAATPTAAPLLSMGTAQKRELLANLLERAAVAPSTWEQIDVVASSMPEDARPAWTRRDSFINQLMRRGLAACGFDSYEDAASFLGTVRTCDAGEPITIEGHELSGEEVFALATFARGSLPASMVEDWMGGANIKEVCARYDERLAQRHAEPGAFAMHVEHKAQAEEPAFSAADAAQVAAWVDSVAREYEETPETSAYNACVDRAWFEALALAERAVAADGGDVEAMREALYEGIDPNLGASTPEGRAAAMARVQARLAGDSEFSSEPWQEALASMRAAVHGKFSWPARADEETSRASGRRQEGQAGRGALPGLADALNAMTPRGDADFMDQAGGAAVRAALSLVRAVGAVAEYSEERRRWSVQAGPGGLSEGPALEAAVAGALNANDESWREDMQRAGAPVDVQMRFTDAEAAREVADEAVPIQRSHERIRNGLLAVAGALGLTASDKRLNSGGNVVRSGGADARGAAAALDWLDENLPEAAAPARFADGWLAARRAVKTHLAGLSLGMSGEGADDEQLRRALAAAADRAEGTFKVGDMDLRAAGAQHLAASLSRASRNLPPTTADAGFSPDGVEQQRAFRLVGFDGVEEVLMTSLVPSDETASGWAWRGEVLASADGGQTWAPSETIDVLAADSAYSAASAAAAGLYGAEEIEVEEFKELAARAASLQGKEHAMEQEGNRAQAIRVALERLSENQAEHQLAGDAGAEAQATDELAGALSLAAALGFSTEGPEEGAWKVDEQPWAMGRQALAAGAELLDEQQAAMDAAAREAGLALDLDNSYAGARSIDEIAGGEVADRLRSAEARIDGMRAALLAAGAKGAKTARGWKVEHDGRAYGVGFSTAADEYGFEPEHAAAAWIVRGEDGEGERLVAMHLYDEGDWAEHEWIYQEFEARDGRWEETFSEGLVGREADGEFLPITDALELAPDGPAEEVDFDAALDMTEAPVAARAAYDKPTFAAVPLEGDVVKADAAEEHALADLMPLQAVWTQGPDGELSLSAYEEDQTLRVGAEVEPSPSAPGRWIVTRLADDPSQNRAVGAYASLDDAISAAAALVANEGCEVVAGSLSRDFIWDAEQLGFRRGAEVFEALPDEEERAAIAREVQRLRDVYGIDIDGWGRHPEGVEPDEVMSAEDYARYRAAHDALNGDDDLGIEGLAARDRALAAQEEPAERSRDVREEAPRATEAEAHKAESRAAGFAGRWSVGSPMNPAAAQINAVVRDADGARIGASIVAGDGTWDVHDGDGSFSSRHMRIDDAIDAASALSGVDASGADDALVDELHRRAGRVRPAQAPRSQESAAVRGPKASWKTLGTGLMLLADDGSRAVVERAEGGLGWKVEGTVAGGAHARALADAVPVLDEAVSIARAHMARLGAQAPANEREQLSRAARAAYDFSMARAWDGRGDGTSLEAMSRALRDGDRPALRQAALAAQLGQAADGLPANDVHVQAARSLEEAASLLEEDPGSWRLVARSASQALTARGDAGLSARVAARALAEAWPERFAGIEEGAQRRTVLYDAADWAPDGELAARKAHELAVVTGDAVRFGADEVAMIYRRNIVAGIYGALSERREEAGGALAFAAGGGQREPFQGAAMWLAQASRVVDDDGELKVAWQDGTTSTIRVGADGEEFDDMRRAHLAAYGVGGDPARYERGRWAASLGDSSLTLTGRSAAGSFRARIEPAPDGSAWGGDAWIERENGTVEHIASADDLADAWDAGEWAEDAAWDAGLAMPGGRGAFASAREAQRSLRLPIWDRSEGAQALGNVAAMLERRAQGAPGPERAGWARRGDGGRAVRIESLSEAFESGTFGNVVSIDEDDGSLILTSEEEGGRRAERELRISPAQGSSWGECLVPHLGLWASSRLNDYPAEWSLAPCPTSMMLCGARLPESVRAFVAPDEDEPGKWSVEIARGDERIGGCRGIETAEEARTIAEDLAFSAGASVSSISKERFEDEMARRDAAERGNLVEFAALANGRAQDLLADWSIATGGADPERARAADAAAALGPLSAYAADGPATSRAVASGQLVEAVRRGAASAGLASAETLAVARAATIADACSMLGSDTRCAVAYRDLAFAPAADGTWCVMKADGGAYEPFAQGWRPGAFSLDENAAACDIVQMETASPLECAEGRWASIGAWVAGNIVEAVGRGQADPELSRRALAACEPGGPAAAAAADAVGKTHRLAAHAVSSRRPIAAREIARTWRSVVDTWANQAQVDVEPEQAEEIARALAYELACRREAAQQAAAQELARRNLVPVMQARAPQDGSRREWEVVPETAQQRSARVRREADDRFTCTLAAAIGLATVPAVMGALVEDKAQALADKAALAASGGGGALQAVRLPEPEHEPAAVRGR